MKKTSAVLNLYTLDDILSDARLKAAAESGLPVVKNLKYFQFLKDGLVNALCGARSNYPMCECNRIAISVENLDIHAGNFYGQLLAAARAISLESELRKGSCPFFAKPSRRVGIKI